MRNIDVDSIIKAVRELSIQANYDIGDEMLDLLKRARDAEKSRLGQDILDEIIENDLIGRVEGLPICQDTGCAVVFLEIGQDVHIVGGDLIEAVNEGVRQGYREGYLRKSVVNCPLRRSNTQDNTPAVTHVEVVPGDRLRITVMPKGAGSENMSALKMLAPADGIEGVKEFIVGQVERAGANACPPVMVGVGIGGSFESVALLAKKALLRPVGSRNSDPFYAALEAELMEEINALGIGPQGLGGSITALAVNIEAAPCHIASLPCAVNLNCHAARHKSLVI